LIGHPNKKINKEILELNDTINQIVLMMSTDYFIQQQHNIYSSKQPRELSPKIDHFLGYKVSLSNYKKIDINPCILSDHHALKLELNNKNNCRKYTNNWRLNNTLLNDQWIIEEIREEVKRFLEANENESTTFENIWDMAKAVLRGNCIVMSAYLKRTERSQINSLMLHSQTFRKTRKSKIQNKQMEKNNKNKGQNY
jgi:hypothetical protein